MTPPRGPVPGIAPVRERLGRHLRNPHTLRPAQRLTLLAAMPTPSAGPLVLAVDVGGTKIALMAWRPAAGVICRTSFSTPSSSTPAVVLHSVVVEATRMLAGEHLALADLAAVGFSVPGPVDRAGIVVEAGNLSGWRQVSLRDIWAAHGSCPVFVEQDANAAALGERWLGCAGKFESFVFLSLGTGIGAGLWLGGSLYRGAHCRAGELGDAIFAVDRSARGLAPTLAEKVGARSIRARAQQVSGAVLGAAAALRQAHRESRLRKLGEEVVDQLALAVIGLSVMVDPEAIVFGGGTARAGETLLADLRRKVRGRLKVQPELLVTELGTDAPLLGAVSGALTMLAPGQPPFEVEP